MSAHDNLKCVQTDSPNHSLSVKESESRDQRTDADEAI